MAAKIFWFLGIVLAIALLVLFISQVRSSAKVEEIARSPNHVNWTSSINCSTWL